MKNIFLKYCCILLFPLFFSCGEDKVVDEPQQIVVKYPTIADYWNGEADWQLYYNKPISDWHGAAGTTIRVVDSTWYWFQRYYQWDGDHQLGTECRKSTDKGLTWSLPIKVIEPTAGTPWSRMATDGDFYYDATTNKWRCLFQSLAESGGWTCSYVERQGKDPMGIFSTPSNFNNPAINGQEIWNQIANRPDKNCVKLSGGKIKQIFDEGTPEIIFQSGSTFYITFHGAAWVGSSIYGFRGIAKTDDFQTYIPAAQDCILSAYDSNKWNVAWQGDLNGNAGSIGVGASTCLKEGAHWYTLAEGADKSLLGTDGQNWTFGLLRSPTVTSTTWENWSNNPVSTFAPHKLLLEWQYARLFKDDNVTYCAINKANPDPERSFRIYKLIWK